MGGSQLVIHCKVVCLLDADDHTLAYMARDPHTFPRSDPKQVILRLKAHLNIPGNFEDFKDIMIQEDPHGTGVCSPMTLRLALARIGLEFGPQECITVGLY